MKTTAFTLFAGFALATATQAGTPSPISAPAPSAGLWQWFAGGSVGYLTDLDEEMYNLHLGMEYKCPGERSSHAIFLQVGFAQDDANYAFYPPPGNGGGRTETSAIDLDIIPITLNYKYEAALTGRLNYYVGLGLGIAILDSSNDWTWQQVTAPPAPFAGNGSTDNTDVRFYGELFAGLTYNVSDAFQVYAGARYIFMDNEDIRATSLNTYDAGINNDVLLEAGMRFHF